MEEAGNYIKKLNEEVLARFGKEKYEEMNQEWLARTNADHYGSDDDSD